MQNQCELWKRFRKVREIINIECCEIKSWVDIFFSNLTLTSNGIINISFANKLAITFSCVHLWFHEKYATKWFRKKNFFIRLLVWELKSCKSFTKSVSYQITTPNRIFSTNKIVKNCLVWTFFSFGHKPVLVLLQNKRIIHFLIDFTNFYK